MTSKVSVLTEKLNSAARDIEKFKAEATNQFNGLMGSYEQLKNATDKSFVKISTAKESLEKERGELKQQLKVYRDAIDKNKVSFENLKQKYVTATEQLTKLKKTVSATESMKQSATEALNVKLKEEQAAKEQVIKQLNISKEKADKLSTALRTANESLIQMTANMFDIDASVLAQRVPTTFSPQQLKSAAEKLANEVVRYSNYNMSGLLTTKEVPQKEEAQESLSSLLGLE